MARLSAEIIMNDQNKIPRRNRLDLLSPEEISIQEAINKIELLGAHPQLTVVIAKLLVAKDSLSDYIDGINLENELPKTEKMTYEEAEKFLNDGKCIALPGWFGFWFKDMKSLETLVFAKTQEVLDTPYEKFKNQEEWFVVEPTVDQENIIADYFKKKSEQEATPLELTLGMNRVQASFNPSNNPRVDEIKKSSAALIDLCESMRLDENCSGEKHRSIALAQTAYEEAAMHAVKANFK